MKTKLYIVLALLCVGVAVMAQNIGTAWLEMPNSLMPYLDRTMRQQLLSQKAASDTAKAVVQNSLNTSTTLEYMSDSRLDLRMDEGVDMTIVRLPLEQDSILCCIKTLSAPEPVSFVTIYNKVWQKIEDVSFNDIVMIQRPDTMTESHYVELAKLIEPKMIRAELLSDDKTLVLDLSLPMTSKEEKERLKAILLQRKVKWDGAIFK